MRVLAHIAFSLEFAMLTCSSEHLESCPGPSASGAQSRSGFGLLQSGRTSLQTGEDWGTRLDLLQANARANANPPTPPVRVVFALTTMAKRVHMIKPMLDAIVEKQTRPADAVYLALPPSVVYLPDWLRDYDKTSSRPGTLHLLRMKLDYGPASKLLAALNEGGERAPGTIIIYGDDDIIYSPSIIEQHVEAQLSSRAPTAFGSRKTSIGDVADSTKENLLEAVGTISLPASAVPDSVFMVRDAPDVCRLSDDYWIAHHLTKAGVLLEMLPHCQFDWDTDDWQKGCGTFVQEPSVQNVDALSQTRVSNDGHVTRWGGDWREQLHRYDKCSNFIKQQLPTQLPTLIRLHNDQASV